MCVTYTEQDFHIFKTVNFLNVFVSTVYKSAYMSSVNNFDLDKQSQKSNSDIESTKS